MQKKSKTILTAVVTALFVLSISYFALLAPTTAWYYQSEDKDLSFTFGDFQAQPDPPSAAIENMTVRLRGATRFADAGETLFDEMIHIVKTTVTNTGRIPGRVSVRVKQNGSILDLTDNTSGLKWFICSSQAVIPDPVANTTASKGSYKQMIEAMLAENGLTPLDYKTGNISSYSGADREAKYEDYNEDALDILKEHNATGVTVEPGNANIKNIYVVFWAEYGPLKSTFHATDSETGKRVVAPVTFQNLSVEVIAKPDTEAALQITNSNVSAVSVTLSIRENNAWVPYVGQIQSIAYNSSYVWTPTAVETTLNGVITIPAANGDNPGSIWIAIPEGTEYRLVLNTSGMHFNDGSDTRIEDVMVVGTNAVSISANGA